MVFFLMALDINHVAESSVHSKGWKLGFLSVNKETMKGSEDIFKMNAVTITI